MEPNFKEYVTLSISDKLIIFGIFGFVIGFMLYIIPAMMFYLGGSL